MTAKQKVLVVDDEQITLMHLKELLEQNGFDIAGTATNGTEAISKAEELKPDLIMMDLVLPKESGMTAISKIVEKDPKTRIIVLSALYQRELVLEAMRYGVKDYLVKPISDNEILESIRRCLK